MFAPFQAITDFVGAEWVALAIIIITLIVFAIDKMPIGVVAMVSSVSLGVFGCMPLTKVYAGWSSILTVMVLCMMIVGAAMFETGAVMLIGRRVMKTRFAQNERVMIALIMLASGFLSAFLSNTATVATFIPLIGAMVASSKGQLKYKHMLMPLGFATAVGGTITLVGSTSQPMVNSILVQEGLEGLKMFDFAYVAVPLFIALIIYMVTIGYKMGLKVLDFEDPVPEVDPNVMDSFKPTVRTWISVLTLVFCVTGFVLNYNMAVIAIIGASVVLITGCVSFKSCLRSLDWNTVFIMAFAQGIASGMNDSGAGKMIADTCVAVVGNNVVLQLAACVIVVTVLTNIMSNTAVAAMMAPIYLLVCSDLGCSYYPFMMAIAIASNLTCATPIGGTAVSMTLVGGYRFNDFVKIGLPINVIIMLMTIVLTPLVFKF